MADHEMLADVYAGDVGTPPDARSNGKVSSLLVHADIEPDVFARVAGVVTLANVAPLSARLWRRGDCLYVSVTLAGVTASLLGSICRKLEQLTTVRRVEIIARSADTDERE